MRRETANVMQKDEEASDWLYRSEKDGCASPVKSMIAERKGMDRTALYMRSSFDVYPAWHAVGEFRGSCWVNTLPVAETTQGNG